MKDITLKITSSKCSKDIGEDNVEFITDGKLYVRNGAIYLVYDETEISGMLGCKTTLKVNGDTLKMKRIGKVGMNAELYFEKGKRFSSEYQTPYGPMDLEVLTSLVKNEIDAEKGKGKIDIEYNVSLEGLAEGKNKLTIDIM